MIGTCGNGGVPFNTSTTNIFANTLLGDTKPGIPGPAGAVGPAGISTTIRSGRCEQLTDITWLLLAILLMTGLTLVAASK